MSKLSFRARAVDATKPLPVYHAEDIPDLSDYSTINRTVPQMPTGMEKEEESERHLQDVILAQQTNGNGGGSDVVKTNIFIPTPEAAITTPHYSTVYNKLSEKPPPFIRVPGLGLDEEVPEYDLDSEDDEWLHAQTNERPLSPTHFERMMDQLERGSGNTVLSVREAQLLLKDKADLVLAVYDYWLAKRLRLGRALIPTVRHERRDGSSSAGNPYLAFRKRTEKMQTRKNRKNDETAYMQMLKLKRDITKACTLADLVKDRELRKHELNSIQMEIFRKRYLLEDWSGAVLALLRPVSTRSASSRHQATEVSEPQWDGRTVLIKMDSEDEEIRRVGRHEVLVGSSGSARKKRRGRKYYYSEVSVEPAGSSAAGVGGTPDRLHQAKEMSAEKSDDEEPDGVFTFRRRPHVKYHTTRDPFISWPWGDVNGAAVDSDGGEGGEGGGVGERRRRKRRGGRYRFSRTSLSGQFVGLARRRSGRGGRTMLDRTPLSSGESEPDSDMELAPPTSSQTATPIKASRVDSEEQPPTSNPALLRANSVPPFDFNPLATPVVITSSSPPDFSSATPSLSVATPPVLMATPLELSFRASSPATPVLPGSHDGHVTDTPGDSRPAKKRRKYLHFHTRSPSPSSHFSPPPLPLIQPSSSSYSSDPRQHHNHQPSSSSSSSSSSSTTRPANQPLSTSPYSAVGGGVSSLVAGLKQREASSSSSSFSSLPTSQFALKPSSLETEGEDPFLSSFVWNSSSENAEPNSQNPTSSEWNNTQGSHSHIPTPTWNQTRGAIGNTATSTTTQHKLSPRENHALTHPLNSASHQSGTEQRDTNRYSSTLHSSAQVERTAASRELSRTSLSVADSKTIILSNAPRVQLQKPAPKTSLTSFREAHLPSISTINASGGSPVTTTLSSRKSTPNENQTSPVKLTERDSQSESVSGNGANKSEIQERNIETPSSPTASEKMTASENGVTPTNPSSKKVSSKSPKTDQTSSDLNSVAPVTPKPAKTRTSQEKPKNVWSMNGPPSGVLQLNFNNAKAPSSSNTNSSTVPPPTQESPRKMRKKCSYFASVETALHVTSQFAAQYQLLQKKREELAQSSPALVASPLPSPPIPPPPPPNTASTHNPSATTTAVATTTTTTTAPVSTATLNSALSDNSTPALQATKSAPNLPPPPPPPPPPNPVQQSQSVDKLGPLAQMVVDNKRTSGQLRPSTAASGATPPTTANGTTGVAGGSSYQELFQSATTRRFSEAERGLKQALHGSMMNHKSLMEKAQNSLVKLSNSSEVT